MDDFDSIETEEEDCLGVGAESKVYIKRYKDEIVAVKVLSNYLINGLKSVI